MSETEKPIDDGGPAMPSPFRSHPGSSVHGSSGMTLRDYFAAKAMQAELSQDKANEYEDMESIKCLAWWAYAVADTMLLARRAERR